ncbi:MAG: thioesterase family protein [Bacteroidales bacterium]|nr:thioesterase family protein [Bacteroidales bacterium]MCF8403219.1 thioesterase family protein [Bacteroidales bacterium]
MEIKVPTGIRHSLEIDVDKSLSACFFGSGAVEVFATPALVAIMEKTAMESILSYLPEGFTSVGSEVNIKHLKATPMGMKVKSESYLKSVNGNKLIFEVHAWDEKGMIGIGTHTRVIVEEKSFMARLK